MDDAKTETIEPETAATVIQWIAAHTADVAAAQDRLAELLNEKQNALAAGHTDRISPLLDAEAAIAVALEDLRQTRADWLNAEPLGSGIDSLKQAAEAVEAPADLIDQIDATRKQAAAIQQQNWAHWVLAQRSSSHFEEMLGLIARRGQTPATYGEQPPESGGGILDAAA